MFVRCCQRISYIYHHLGSFVFSSEKSQLHQESGILCLDFLTFVHSLVIHYLYLDAFVNPTFSKMQYSLALLGALASAGFANAAVFPRASCTFTDAASAIKGKTSCTSIILKDIAVPAGTTLDMTGLKSGTHVRYTFPLIPRMVTVLNSKHYRSPSRERPPLATRSGADLSSPFLEATSSSTVPRATPLIATARDGGTARAATVERPSPSSSTLIL